MRNGLEALYRFSGILAALFLMLTFLTVLLQVSFNIIDWSLRLFGMSALGLLLPSYTEFAGFFMASSTFLALAHTFREGGHIRVKLALNRLGGPGLRAMNLLCVALCLLITAVLLYSSVGLAYDSFVYSDYSYGLIAIPTWIPQMSLVAGLGILAISLLDCLITSARGTPFDEATLGDDGFVRRD